MGHALSNRLAASVASLSPAPVYGDRASGKTFRKSAKIVTDDRLCLATARQVLRDNAEEVIKGAFPAPSRHQTCKDAAKACGISPDSVLRLMQGEVGTPDAMILGHYARLYGDRTGKVSPIIGVLAQIIAAEVTT